jgi:hypothetical protein
MMDDLYFVQVQENGCAHCGAGRMWTIITPDGSEWSQSWGADEDGECPADAHEMCASLNRAFHEGYTSRLDLDIAVDSFLAWKLPADFAPDQGIVFTPGRDWPTGTNLLTANQARAMLAHVLEQSHADTQPRCNITGFPCTGTSCLGNGGVCVNQT